MSNVRPLLPPAEAIKQYEKNRCPPGYCDRDPARPCASTCRYAQVEAILNESTKRAEAPPPEQEDPLAAARGIVNGLLIMAGVATFFLIAYGIGRTLSILNN